LEKEINQNNKDLEKELSNLKFQIKESQISLKSEIEQDF